MKKISIFYILLCFCTPLVAQEDFRKTAPEPGPAPKIEFGDYQKFQLDNGLQVIVVENHKLPRVSFQVFIDVPPLQEGEKAGIQSMTGSLLRSGTSKRNKAELDEAIDFIGATFSPNAKGIFASSLTKHKDKLLELMTEVLYEPSFPEEEFTKERQQRMSSLAASKENPNAISSTVSKVLRYGKDHPYGEMITESSLQNIGVADCKQYYETYFKPNIAYLIIVGDITGKEAEKLARQYFGPWQKGTIETPIYKTPKAPTDKQVTVVGKTGAVQSAISITYPLDLQPGGEDAVALTVMNTILGGGRLGSRLNANIREDKGYSYGVGSTLSSDPLVGYFAAGGSVRNEVTDSAIAEFLYEMNRIRTEKISREELQLNKSFITGNFARGMESPQTVAGYALNMARFNLPEDYYSTYLKRLNALTPDNILEVAKKYIKPDQTHILVVGNRDEIADKLKRFDSDGVVDFLDAFGDPVKAPTSAGDISGEQVIEQYLKAIGGSEKLSQIKELSMTMSGEVQGQSLSVNRMHKNGKLLTKVSAMGMVVQEMIFNGEKGKISVMGNQQTMEGPELERTRQQAVIFPELNYKSEEYQLEVAGIEQVNNEDAYKVLITGPSGNQATEFFSKTSGLKLRTILQQEAQGQKMTVTNEYADYKAVDGILFPYQITSTGAAPFPVQFKVEAIELNGGIDDSVFKIE